MQSRVLALVIGACVCVVGCGETFSPVVQADPGGLFEPVPDWQGPESSGGESGETFGEASGETFGEEVGEASGETFGEESGQESGETFGEESGQESGETFGEESGQESGETFGEESGQESGETFGEESGQESGEEVGQEAGQESGDETSQESGQESGDETSQESGQESGEETGEEIWVIPDNVNCATLPQGPFQLTKLNGPMASEDLAFDDAGNVVGSNDQTIFKSPYNGSPAVFVPNIKFRAGMRYLPTGDLVVCNDNKGQLVRVEPDGVQHVILYGLSYPNGMTVDLEGYVYFSEHDGQKVWKVNPYTSEKWLVTTEIGNPNGVAFSPDYKHLYIDGFSGAKKVYRVEILPNHQFGPTEVWANNVGSGWLDGIGVDICGNVYICDYKNSNSDIYRLNSDGQNKTKIVNGVPGRYLPNMQWGSGIGGWDPWKLYIPDGWQKGVFEANVGVPGILKPYP
jgi:sugar lactone lactonase YvrE